MRQGATLPQRMLGYANRTVLKRKEAGHLKDGKYRTAVVKAPSLVKSCGLAQGLAFFEAKKENEKAFKYLLEDLRGMPGVGDLSLDAVCGLSTPEYMRATLRALDGLGYLKRMVEAHREREAGEDAT